MGNKDVSFGDVDMSQDRISFLQGKGGKGGWPTILYYNAETGTTGGEYKRKEPGPVCQELGKPENMNGYVLEYGKTTLDSLENDEL